MKPLLLACLLVLLTLGAAHAVDPGEQLPDPALEARARQLSAELRCLVCQNQSIDDSNAPLAHDLRVLVRERLMAGDSDEQVLAYLRARYGDFVLLDPPVERATWILWLGPPLTLALGLGIVLVRVSKRTAGPDIVPLGPADRAELNAVLREDLG